MKINKCVISKTKNVKSISDEDMQKINSFALSSLTSDDVFVFSVILCDNEIDRDGERFTVESLKTLETLFVGKTAIMNHSMKTEDQSARTFKTQLIRDGRKNSLGEDYYYLKAWAYMVKTESNQDLITEIQAGIKKETSVGCSVADVRCSICGESRKKKRCSHVKGQVYGEKICFDELVDPTDAYEWSFVAVPAQRNAGVTKAFYKEERNLKEIVKSMSEYSEKTLTPEECKELYEEFVRLEKLAEDGEEYRKSLIKNIISLAAVALPEISAQGMGEICDSLSIQNLKNLSLALEKKKAASLPVGYQTYTGEAKTDSENSSFKF